MATRCGKPLPAYLPTAPGFQNADFPDACGSNDAHIIIYGYTPSLAICIVAMITFFLAGLLHYVFLIRHRTWSFSPLVVGCVMEILGYVFRALSSQKDPYSVTYSVAQYFLIVVAPVFISASIYVCLSQLLAYVRSATGYARNWLSRKPILFLFISIDAVTTILQVTGAGLVGHSESNGGDPTIGNNILTAGLAVQTAAFTCFISLLVAFRISVGRDPQIDQRLIQKKDWFTLAVFVASLGIYLRTIFRLAESAQGFFNNINTNETLFGVLEFAPVSIAVIILALFHPGRWLPRSRPKRPSRRGREHSEK
ncbi:MAG: hypothetical protein M1828_004022 [Chrysothrix sp. TS-e1954]|nr:MAG: hypothetical protein M1828_004022 [Chrysothrix sp. TS-e1954]